MTGDEVREFYNKMKSQTKIKVVINGQPIPYLSDYSFVDAKSFFKEPVRSASGVINNLNSYATFLTPRLKFSFKLMPVDTYRTLMKLIKDYNEFIVTVYDIVEDKYVTHKMYFHPKDFPAIYQHNLETLGILDESFELVGTNASLEELSIVYNSNPPIESEATLTTGATINYNDEFIVGTYDSLEGVTNPNDFSYSGYSLQKWNTKADGTGISYFDGDIIDNISSSMVLYAIWKANGLFTLSFDYQNATSGNTQLNKEISQNSQIGTLPTPIKNGYTFNGWYTLPNGQGQLITESSVYNFSGNKTIYAYWIGVENTIIFENNGGTGNMTSMTVRTGESVKLPKATFVKNGEVFYNWNTQPDGQGTSYSDEQTIVIADSNIVLYAIYTRGFYLTYNTNGGINDDSKYFGKVFKEPIYTEKSGYALAGWYSDQELTNALTFPITLNADTTIYARWEEITNVE